MYLSKALTKTLTNFRIVSINGSCNIRLMNHLPSYFLRNFSSLSFKNPSRNTSNIFQNANHIQFKNELNKSQSLLNIDFFSIPKISRSNYSTFTKVENVTSDFIVLSNEDGISQKIHRLWLRDHCRCDKCIDPQTGQKFVRIEELIKNNSSTKIKNINQNGDSLKIIWNDGHESNFLLKWLYLHTVQKAHNEIKKSRKIQPWDKNQLSQLPTIDYGEIVDLNTQETKTEGLFNWMKNLSEYGLCIVKNTPIDNTSRTRELVERISYVQNSIYGLDWEVVVDPGHLNVAYTSIELGIHMDLCYYESPPGFQFLHCFKQSDKGGENFVVDLFKVAEDLRSQNLEAFNTLCNNKISFHNGSLSHNHVYYRRSLIDLNEDGEIESLYYSPYWEAPFVINQDEAESFYNAFILWNNMIKDEKYNIEFRLNEGEVLSFNNRRIGHARRSFDNSSARHLQGTYISTDEFANRYRTLRKILGRVNDPLKHLGNSSHDLCIEEIDYKI